MKEIKKIVDLGKKEREDLREFLDSRSSELGLDSYVSGDSGGRRNFLEEKIGICHKCKNLMYARGEFITLIATCTRFETKLNGKDKIVECSEFSERGKLSLEQMTDMAYLIESNKKEIKGFI